MNAGVLNRLYCGDNLDVLRRYVEDASVDLIYLDPPFKSNQDYVLLAEKSGKRSAAQIRAFEDTWHWDESAASAYHQTVEVGGPVSQALQAFRTFLGENDMLAYLAMMAPRLVELRRTLKASGSLYLHCDPTASHYLKLLLDAVFRPQYFRNEVIWKRANAHNDPKRYGRISDALLFYTKGDTYVWNAQHTPYREEYYESHFKKDDTGRWFRTVPLDAPRHGVGSANLLYDWKGKSPAASRTWAVKIETMQRYEREGLLRYTRTGTPTLLQYADDMPGVPLQNIWTDIPPVNPQAQERLGYPTQKPEALLERIIIASSNEGDVVLDPFCGCGTTIAAAQKLRRRWIGIDITHLAIGLIKTRLSDMYRDQPSVNIRATYEVIGEPTSGSSSECAGDVISIGTVDGKLEGRIINGKNRLIVCDILTGRQVVCYFTDRIPYKDVLVAFGKRVAVTGMIRSRRSGKRVDIRVTSLYVMPPNEELPGPEEVLGILKMDK